MDPEAQSPREENGFEDEEEEEEVARPRTLPADLPKSLDDRQPVRQYGGETEMYDAWAGIYSRRPCLYYNV